MAESSAPREGAVDALVRARRHARRGAAEWVLALRALLDAAALGLGQESAARHALLAPFSEILDQWSQRLGGSEEDLGAVILDALGAEIERWERRGADDDEARSVLRALIGLREILWELGLRPHPEPDPGARAFEEAETPASETAGMAAAGTRTG